MHPTLFQLKAFGELRLPPREAAGVLRHLHTGCGRCRAALAPWLMPWLDEAPGAEARAGDPARCGARLAGEYERAARRAARAAVRRRTEDSAAAADRDMQRVVRLLAREGPG